MTVKLKTRNVDRSSFSNYLKKATECHRAAVRSYELGDWNAAANMAEYEERLVFRKEAEKSY